MKKTVTKESIKVIESVFKESYIYTIDEFPVNAAKWDVGCGWKDQIQALRGKWLFDRYGIFEDLENYSSFYRRLNEFMYHGDFLHTLRQRLNIIHLMIECNFDTNTPVHISIAPTGRSVRNGVKNIPINLHRGVGFEHLNIIAHPGQTRFQASVIANQPLKNTLIYINKKFIDEGYLLLKTEGLKRINNLEELLQHHRPVVKNKSILPEDIDSFEYSFNYKGLDGGNKYHEPTQTYILKAFDVFVKGSKVKGDDTKGHPSTDYMVDSFIMTDKFFRLLFKSRLNLYTNNVEQIEKNQKENFDNLVQKFSKTTDVAMYSYMRSFKDFALKGHNNFPTNPESIESVVNRLKKLLKPHSLNKHMDTVKVVKELIKRHRPTNNPLNFNIQLSALGDPLYYVKQNNYKGICFVINGDTTRLYEELLLFCPPSLALTRSSDNRIMIINCEHDYWRTGKGFKEYILTDSFMKL